MCLTEAHKDALWQRLNACTLSAATDEANPLYDCNLASAVKSKPADKDKPDKEGPGKPKNKLKDPKEPNKKKAKTGKKPDGKKKTKPTGDFDDEEDPFQEEHEEEDDVDDEGDDLLE